MLRNYVTSALRYLLKNRTYTVLNIVGLSVGLACFTLIGLWVKGELSYDRFHSKADHIFRIGGTFTDESGSFDQAVTPCPLAPALVSDFPEVEAAVRLDNNGATVQLGDKQFLEDDILLTDPSFFEVFDFKLLAGNPETVLNEPYQIVLSQSMAKKYFGDENPIGQSLRIYQYDPEGNGAEYKITGIVEDCPRNSHFHYNFLASFSTIGVASPGQLEQWFDNSYYTYILLREGSGATQFQSRLPQLVEKYMGETSRNYKMNYDYFLQPLTSIHLGSHLRYEIRETSSKAYVTIFGTIGVIVLLLACINYVNLSTAYSSSRFREVGMRKVMGAPRAQLVGQYLTESWILAMGSLLLAIIWIELSRGLFEGLTGQPIGNLYSVPVQTILFGVTTVVGVLAGIYPSLVLSAFRPVGILKGQLKSGSSGALLRKGLVVVQYTITIILVIGILVVRMQLQFVQEKDLGYDKSNLLMLGVNGNRDVMNGYDGFANELLSYPAVEGIARSSSTLGGGLGNSVAEAEDVSGKMVNGTVYRLRVDHDYIDTYKMRLLAGRFFAEGNAADSASAYVVNEATIRQYGYQDPEGAVGKPFRFGGNSGKILGVVRDFNFKSLLNPVEPVSMQLLRGGFSRISVRFSGSLQGGRDLVGQVWKKHFPGAVADFTFADEAVNATYKSQQRFARVFLVFSGISMAIACLGLFALVSYSVSSRTREIGIRKVLGATVAGIAGMLSREFLLLIVMAAFVAAPLGYYFMDRWLQDFAYRIDLSPVVFVVAGALVVVVAWLTVGLRSIRAASVNPVESLRNE